MQLLGTKQDVLENYSEKGGSEKGGVHVIMFYQTITQTHTQVNTHKPTDL